MRYKCLGYRELTVNQLLSYSSDCPEYQYGVNCQLTCGHCENDEICDPVTGACANGCVPGFTGIDCSRGILCLELLFTKLIPKKILSNI